MHRLGTTALYALPLGVAGYAVLAYTLAPPGALVHPEMRAVFESHSMAIRAHVLGAAVALALGPFQFSRRLRGRQPKVHRWLGRTYLGVGVLVGGVAGLWMAAFAQGGAVGKLGFGLLAAAWLSTGALAYAAIRRRDTASHRRWMVRNFALTCAAVTLRLYLPGSMAAGIPFEIAYPAIAWLCWVPNVLVAERVWNRAAAPGPARLPGQVGR